MRVTVAQVRAKFPQLRELTDEQIAALIEEYWPLSPLDKLDLGQYLILGPDDSNTVTGKVLPMAVEPGEQSPSRGWHWIWKRIDGLSGRREGEPPPEYRPGSFDQVPHEPDNPNYRPPSLERVRNGPRGNLVAGEREYLDSYGPRVRQRTIAEAQALVDGEPTYSRHGPA